MRRTIKCFGSKKTRRNGRYIPLSMNTNYYGKLLSNKKFNFYLLKINFVNKLQGKPIINNENINSMYLYKNKYIILNRVMVGSAIKRFVYSASTGIFLEKVVDLTINKNRFFRIKGKNIFIVVNNKVIGMQKVKKVYIFLI